MSNTRLAHRYAKSIIDLSIERNKLEVVYADMKYLQAVCKASAEFRTLLASPVIKADKKEAIIKAVTGTKVSELTNAFTKLLTTKGREGDLFEIANSFIAQYNELKGIQTVKLTTAVEISEELKQSIQATASTTNTSGTIQLETSVNPDLIGGFVLEFNNKLVDASILHDLKVLKLQFMENHYVDKM
jgi:F-type H+-transporting ATPase subunit delta